MNNQESRDSRSYLTVPPIATVAGGLIWVMSGIPK